VTRQIEVRKTASIQTIRNIKEHKCR